MGEKTKIGKEVKVFFSILEYLVLLVNVGDNATFCLLESGQGLNVGSAV